MITPLCRLAVSFAGGVAAAYLLQIVRGESPPQSAAAMVTYCVRRCLMLARNVSAGASSGLRLLSSHAPVQSTSTTSKITGAFHLDRRGVVRLAGRDMVDLLQGLVTSDVTELTKLGHSAQYSMMLSVQVGVYVVA